MCSKRCCSASARSSRRSRLHSIPSEAPTRTGTTMGTSESPDEGALAPALYRLMAWLSPAFPVGAFSYSSGLEWAVEAGDIADAATLRDWLSAMLTDGAGSCDATFFVHAYRAAQVMD